MTDPYPITLAALLAALALTAGARGCLGRARGVPPLPRLRARARPALPGPSGRGRYGDGRYEDGTAPGGRTDRTPRALPSGRTAPLGGHGPTRAPGLPGPGRTVRCATETAAAPEDTAAAPAATAAPGPHPSPAPARPARAVGSRSPGPGGTQRQRTAHGGPDGARARGRGHTVRAALVVAAGVAALLVGAGAPAVAHPLGNFSVNRYDGLVVSEHEVRVDHVEDLAEIPTARIRPWEMPPAALAAWAEQRCAVAAREAGLLVNGRAVRLEAGSARASVRPGQAGLPTLRVECAMRAPLPGGRADLAFTAAPGEGAGWREITARGDRTTLTASDVPRESVSRRLSVYPQKLLDSPPAGTEARLTAVPGGPVLDDAAAAAPPSVLPRGVDRWTGALTELVERRDLTVPFGALALLVALGLGALHALAPGHGKTLMAAAAAAGGRSSLREVLALGASVTVTHTLGVFALGALIVAGSAVTPAVVGWLGMASGVLVAVAGALLARRAWRDRAQGRGHTHVHWLGGGRFRTYAHTHSSGDGHGPAHRHGHGHGHSHGDGNDHGHERSRDGARDHGHGHHHEPDHHHEHEHGHGPTDEHAHHQHGHGPGHPHGHTGHGPTSTGDTHRHDHDSERQRPLRRSILLGLAGGLVPSPSAVVVLVGAAALGHAWFGLLLVIAYGAGLALTLTAAGFAVVRLGARVAARLARRRAAGRLVGFVQRSAPIGTALTVVLLGCGLVLRGAAGAMT
ncbi:sulfite exporter TauE/SafE family protein [Streptomyces sp. NPDC019208]|uniref:urease accessory protein UreH domain-containing protein n=1 Tax=Streptomyces sp. NPDC019208 TaxID=3154683 RepID=UPI0033E46391